MCRLQRTEACMKSPSRSTLFFLAQLGRRREEHRHYQPCLHCSTHHLDITIHTVILLPKGCPTFLCLLGPSDDTRRDRLCPLPTLFTLPIRMPSFWRS